MNARFAAASDSTFVEAGEPIPVARLAPISLPSGTGKAMDAAVTSALESASAGEGNGWDLDLWLESLAPSHSIFSGTVPELSSVCLANGGALIGAGMPAPTLSGTTIAASSSPPG